MKRSRHGVIFRAAALAALCGVPAVAFADTPDDMSRPFDQYSWVTTHNAFTSNGLIPNQSQTIATQLDAGVRAFMLDLYPHDGRVALCHNRCTGTPAEQRDRRAPALRRSVSLRR